MIAAITGANGFIGQHLVHCFGEAGWDVRPIVRGDFATTQTRLEERFRGVDVVVHAAGATRAPTERLLHEANVALTERVANAARAARVGRLVFLSSQAAAGPSTSRERSIDEETTPQPIERYGKTKLDAERVLHCAVGLPFVVVRPAAVYGPKDRDFLSMFRLVHRGIAVHPGNREQWISIVHVHDLAMGVLRASSAPSADGKIFFMANAEPIQWGELFSRCAASVGRKLVLDAQVPRALVRAGALLGDVAAQVTRRASLLTSRKVALSAPKYWICSSQRAYRELGFAPAISLDDGLRTTYEWYAANGWL